jgi:cell division protein ZapD
VILYEYPFNERVRTYLRLESLFRRLLQLLAREQAIDHHFALATLFDIMEVAGRSDLKSEVLKDLDRQKSALAAYRGNPAIAEAVLEDIIGKLDACYGSLQEQSGKPGQALGDNEWLMGVRSRIAIPGGTCEFDLPGYHAWQQLDPARRQGDLQRWAKILSPIVDPVRLLLKLLRDSGAPQKVMATGGQLQQNLPQGRSFQLLRLRIDPTLNLVPEISGNRLMVVVRLMTHEPAERLRPSSEDVSFELALCA